MSRSFAFRILHRFGLFHQGREIPVRGQKHKAILAWFCLTGENAIARDRLADLLWSDSEVDKARGSLRNTLHVLARDAAPLDLFEAGRSQIKALFAGAPCEVTQALRAWDHGDDKALLACSLAEAELQFAADLWGLDPAFDQFLTERRKQWTEAMAAQLRQRVAACEGTPRARLPAERLRELCPQDEEATRALMRVDMAAGNRAAALEHYRRLWEVLDEEFDLEPAAETQALAVRLKLSDPAPEPMAPPQDERITIFLQPFAAAPLPEEDQILLASVHAELAAALFAVDDWAVVEAASGMVLPEKPGHYELRGMLSPGLEHVRLLLSLKDLASGAIIWSWPLQLHQHDWLRSSGFAVQRMAMRLTGRLEAHYISSLDRFSDDDLEDYRKLMRARWLMRDWDADADRRAEQLLRSVSSAGDLGLRARIGLAELLNSRELIFPGMGPVHAGVPEALALSRRCTEDAPDRGDAWLAFGWSSMLQDRIDDAAQAAEMVVSLSQSNPRRLSGAAEMMALSGQVDRAARLAEAAAQIDAGVCRASKGYRTPVALLRGDYALAMDLAEAAQGTIPFTYAYGAAAGVMAGDDARAMRLWQLFCDDLAARWQGVAPPDPLQWFLQASSMRRGHGLERLIDPLSQLAAQRQERVV